MDFLKSTYRVNAVQTKPISYDEYGPWASTEDPSWEWGWGGRVGVCSLQPGQLAGLGLSAPSPT